jgi:hypothetical protein
MNDPDRFAWQALFVSINKPAGTGQNAIWETWASDEDTFPANPNPNVPPTWPGSAHSSLKLRVPRQLQLLGLQGNRETLDEARLFDPNAVQPFIAPQGKSEEVRVFYTRTSDLVQRLQIARREFALEAAIQRLDRYHLLILDDLVYVTKDQAEISVLFELISARYERRSVLITANQPFGEWGKVFQDPAMTLAAVDRLVHHATIFEMNVESYRRRAALARKKSGPGRTAQYATTKNVGTLMPNDNQTET